MDFMLDTNRRKALGCGGLAQHLLLARVGISKMCLSVITRVTTIVLAALAVTAIGTAPADAASRPFWLGVDEPSVVSASPEVALALSARIESAGARFQRVALSWREIAPKRPKNPQAWNDPSYRWAYADDALRAAADRRPGIGAGLDPIITIEGAPDWAQASRRPRTEELRRYPGAWKPDLNALRDFATALSSRFAGGRKNIRGRLLPKVKYFQVWNEPNLSTHLAPQYGSDRSPFASIWYRRMTRSFRQGARVGGGSGVVVIAAGLAPFGNVSGASAGTAPQTFQRAVLCLTRTKRGLRPVKGCDQAAFDVWAQHPYDIAGSPRRSADRSGLRGVVADLPAIRSTLDRAVALRTVTPVRRKPLWVTEFDWWTNPPARSFGASPATAARWMVDSFRRMWLAGVDVMVWYRVRDTSQWPGGLWYSGSSAIPSALTLDRLDADSEKPLAAMFRWPFMTVSDKRPYAWGVVPCRLSGVTVAVERLASGGWVRMATSKSESSGVFRAPIGATAKGLWRAVPDFGCGSQSSVWSA